MIKDEDVQELREPLVSVVVTTHNRPAFCEIVLRSIARQSYPAIETVIVDDGSEPPYLDRLSSQFRDWTFVRCAENRGVQYASMVGFHATSGEFVAFVGDDDPWIDDDKIAKQVSLMLLDPRIGVVAHKWRLQETNKVIGHFPAQWPKNPLRTIMRGNGFISGSAALIRRSAFEEVNGFDADLKKGTDSDVFRRILLAGWGLELMDDIMIQVQVGHPRMTSGSPQLGLRERRAQMHLVRKYMGLWWKYPEAFVYRLYLILKSYRLKRD